MSKEVKKKYGVDQEEIERLLKQLVEHCEAEDKASRERQIRTWRRLKLLWEGFSRTWYSETAHDWRVWDLEQNNSTDQEYYDKPINVFRAYLESIIAALSVVVPPIKCYPDDADNGLDIITAKTGDKIAELIARHNDVSLLWLHALFIYCTEGMVASYTYSKEDKEYGTYREKKYEDIEGERSFKTCPLCNNVIDESSQENQQADGYREELESKFRPDDDDAKLEANKELCSNCMLLVDPELKTEKFTTTRIVGETEKPKSRICMEAYGGLNVKISNWARKQSECPYLIYSYETHYANVLECWPELRDNESVRKLIDAGAGSYDHYDQWGRVSPQYQGEYPINVVTVKHCWLRPAIYNILKDDDERDLLKKYFPNGAKVSIASGEYADSCNDNLDDSWTLTYNPLADYLQSDPIGMLLVSVQDITNDLVSLTVQTIEHGIGQTFADPRVLDFDAYSQQETVPGGIYAAKAGGGKQLAEGFFELRTANLSPEVLPFGQNIQSLGQLVSGAQPSLFGGQIENKTASVYSMSRAQSLQRLQNTWKMFTSWWKQIFGKVIPLYINLVKEQGDEKDVQRDKSGNFINVFILKAELEGKIGKIELEASENLPMTWSQVRDVIMQLMQSPNPEAMSLLTAPENLEKIREAIGLTDFYIPGEDDRTKQYEEIKELLESQPIPTGDMQFPEAPSVDVDPDFDNHQIEFEICRQWITGEAGRVAKITNEPGYRNVLLHGRLHQMAMLAAQQQMNQQSEQQSNGKANPEKPDSTKTKEAPIMNNSDVSTVQ